MLGSAVTGSGVIRAGEVKIRACKGKIREGEKF